MLASLTYHDFAPHVGSAFSIVTGAPDGHLDLTAVSPASQAPVNGRQGFALTFRSSTLPPLPQGTHRLRHGALGDIDLFLVPLGPEGADLAYEAIFN